VLATRLWHCGRIRSTQRAAFGWCSMVRRIETWIRYWLISRYGGLLIFVVRIPGFDIAIRHGIGTFFARPTAIWVLSINVKITLSWRRHEKHHFVPASGATTRRN